MLHKKFKPSKCKTALNLAKSRIKLFKNRKDIQVKQLRSELARLLESGQDQTARIRVEHVVREEKTMAAFELIEIYCELVVARLPILESQKNCPPDLKEAVTSLIFAAPRCGDIPELQDVRKHFTAKYGKEFVAAATELRPNCGVSRNLVEKLSAKAPDGPTKVKILTAIAEEHNIKWEPRWFEDENPAPPIEMPQNEQKHMEKAGKIQVEPLDFGIADNFQHPQVHDAGRSKTSSQNRSSANIDVNEVSPSTSRPDGRRESYFDGKAFSYSSGIAENAVEASRQNWQMEFKDATAAAQAAAESAERASMAATAAAELSRNSYIVNEASSTPLGSSVHGWNQDKNVYVGSVLKDKHVEEHPANSSFNQRTPNMQVDRLGAYQQGNNPKGTEATSFVEDSTESGVGYGSEREEYRESKNIVHPIYQEVEQSGDSLPTPNAPEVEYDAFESAKHQKYGNVPVDKPFHEETTKIKIQPCSSEYEYSSFGDEYGIFSNLNDRNKNYSDDSYYGGSNHETGANNGNWHVNTFYHSGMDDDSKVDPTFIDQGEGGRISGSDDQKYRFNSGENIFVSMDNGTKEMDDTKEIAAHTDSGAVFDESGSDDDESIFGHAGKSYDLPSSGKTSPKHFTFHLDSPSSSSSHLLHGLDVSESFRKSPLFAKLSEPLPVKFDSDGESSGSERELQNEKPVCVIVDKYIGNRSTNPDMGSTHKETQTIYDAGDLHTPQPSYEHRSLREESHNLDHASAYNLIHEAKHEKPLPSSRLCSQSSGPVSELEDETQAGPEDGIELNLGLLPSGRKNRQMWDPPYRRDAVASLSLFPRSSAVADGGPNPQVSSSIVETTHSFKKTSSGDTHLNSICDDPRVIITPKIPSSAERPYIPTIYQTANRTWKDPTGYFHSNNSSSEDESPKQPAMSKNLLGAGLSRRTKGPAARSVAGSQPSATTEHVPDSSSSAPEVSPKLQTETVGPRSRHTENSRWDEPARRRRSDRKVSDNAYSSLSAAERQLTPSDLRTPRPSNSNEKAPSRDNSAKKPGHVHPKLPDFETLTARLQSLRTNHQQ